MQELRVVSPELEKNVGKAVQASELGTVPPELPAASGSPE